MTNAEVARLLREMSDLLALQNANPFRVRAYRTAARIVEDQSEPIASIASKGVAALDALPGIGADLASTIDEIVRTGRLRALARAARDVPSGLVELLHVRGLGPKRVRALHHDLGITGRAGLLRALRRGAVRGVRGFGPITEAKLLAELEAVPGTEHRLPRAVAAEYGDLLLGWLRDVRGVGRVELAGSFRRARETVGDLDILAEAEDGDPVTTALTRHPQVAEVLERGSTRCSVRLRSGLQVDLRVVPPRSYGAALHYFTGSTAHNIAIRHLGQLAGLRISEYGVFRGARQLSGALEAEVFGAVGLPWIPPELRENRGEIEAARAGSLPRLLTLDQIRGDLQCHTTASDGRDTLEAMAHAAEALGYAYLAITNHTTSMRVTGGLDRAGFRAERRDIDRLNRRLRHLTLLQGAEVDIHADGTLDLDPDTRAHLDLVVVGVHSAFDLPPRQQTDRLRRAVGTPGVDILAHPTGRLIGRRAELGFDVERVFAAARDHGVLLEVNAQPERMDLDDLHIRQALQLGNRLAISTDAHSTTSLGLMRWGVDQARRGWTEAGQVANTLPLEGLSDWLHGGRRR